MSMSKRNFIPGQRFREQAEAGKYADMGEKLKNIHNALHEYYVRAAAGEKLVTWIERHLDQAAGIESD